MRAYQLYLYDNEQIAFGDSQDFKYYHDGSNSYIDNVTGQIRIRVKTNEYAIICKPDAEVELYYDNSARFKTNTAGVQFSADGAAWSGVLKDGETSPSGTDELGYNGYFYATRVYNAVWNDLADFHLLDDELIYGKCYYQSPTGSKICNKKCQKGLIGIASDTYGISAGSNKKLKTVPISVAGWVLAFVDKEYKSGTPLTTNQNGELTKMSFWRKLLFPERLVATYGYKEEEEKWGPAKSEVIVNGRHWVKIS